jgi:hypothetical protein
LLFSQRSGVRGGQKHLPDLNTPAMTNGYPGANNNRTNARQRASECET